jgi:hypothetical protein
MSHRDKRPRPIVYLKMRLGNDIMDNGRPEGKFFMHHKKINTMIKSAIYLLQRKSFAKITDYIQERSDIILQDDTGVPFRAFDKNLWDIRLFGEYTRSFTLKDLKNPPAQPELAAEYKLNKSPLPFSFGYGVLKGKGYSNLMVAVKRSKVHK